MNIILIFKICCSVFNTIFFHRRLLRGLILIDGYMGSFRTYVIHLKYFFFGKSSCYRAIVYQFLKKRGKSLSFFMVVIKGIFRERQFIRATTKIICARSNRGIMIILPARRRQAKVKCISRERS